MVAVTSLLQSIDRIAKMLSNYGCFESLTKKVLKECTDTLGAWGGAIYFHKKQVDALFLHHGIPEDTFVTATARQATTNQGLIGNIFTDGVCKILMPTMDDKGLCQELGKRLGQEIQEVLASPIMVDGELPVGVIFIANKIHGEFTKEESFFLKAVSSSIALAYKSVNLLEESHRVTSLRGMGQVAHDMKNLTHALEANVHLSDQILNELKDYANALPSDDTFIDYIDTIGGNLEDLFQSIDRVKRYSTLISDLSSGKHLSPAKKLAPLAQCIQLAAAYLESEGRKNHIALRYEIQHNAPPMVHDEMYVFRIVQNLVSNAIKAGSEKILRTCPQKEPYDEFAIYDEIYVRYRFDKGEQTKLQHIIEIEDHGSGMTKEMVERILMGNAMSSWYRHAGSGWGTKIVLELAATHNAKVDIQSALGEGTTIRICFPHTEK